MSVDLLVFGDSVMWGQGLLDQHKSCSLVANGLNAKFPGIQPVIIAHSGAVIGRSATCSPAKFPGEVPESCPSILQQIPTYNGDPTQVPVIMINGGINDIDIRTILNPFTLSSDLKSDILQYCYTDMVYLLGQVKARYTNPTTKIVVSSYFPILSTKSDLDLVPQMVEFMGAPVPSFINTDPAEAIFGIEDPILGKIISLCQQFWDQSNQAFSDAVAEANKTAGARCFFAKVPFTDVNSVFAPQAWLWGVGDAPDFAPLDEVAAQRRPQCDLVFANDFFAREQCYRASAGHPNVTGAQQFSQAILSVLG